MTHASSTQTMRRASFALRPETIATCTFGNDVNVAIACWVSAGTVAYSGRGAIGESVPSTSSNSNNGRPPSRSAMAGGTGSASMVVMPSDGGDAPGASRLLRHDLRRARENGVEPVEDGRVVKLAAHAMHPSPALFRRHLERGANGADESVDVERIDEQRAVDLFRRSGEAAEEEYAAFVELARDEFLGHEIHSVLQRRHDAEIGRAIDAGEQIGIDVLVDQHDRRPVVGAEFGVDVDDGLSDF